MASKSHSRTSARQPTTAGSATRKQPADDNNAVVEVQFLQQRRAHLLDALARNEWMCRYWTNDLSEQELSWKAVVAADNRVVFGTLRQYQTPEGHVALLDRLIRAASLSPTLGAAKTNSAKGGNAAAARSSLERPTLAAYNETWQYNVDNEAGNEHAHASRQPQKYYTLGAVEEGHHLLQMHVNRSKDGVECRPEYLARLRQDIPELTSMLEAAKEARASQCTRSLLLGKTAALDVELRRRRHMLEATQAHIRRDFNSSELVVEPLAEPFTGNDLFLSARAPNMGHLESS